MQGLHFFLDKIYKLLTYHTLTIAKLSTFKNGPVFFWPTLYMYLAWTVIHSLCYFMFYVRLYASLFTKGGNKNNNKFVTYSLLNTGVLELHIARILFRDC